MPQKLIKIGVLIFALLFIAEVKAQDQWIVADKKTVRLDPKMFSQLPKTIISDLTRRRCTIPQSYIQPGSHNVIKGEFKIKGQKDWAVLCSRKGVSSILIYWNGSIKNASSIASAEDKDFLQGIGGDEIGFSRVLGVANAKYIDDHFKAYGGTTPPVIAHNGIINAFAEKASKVLYRHRGKCLTLQGAD